MARGRGRQQERLDDRRPHQLLRVDAIKRVVTSALARRGQYGQTAVRVGQKKLDL